MNAPEQMVLASRLTDGRTVFLTANGRWVEEIAEGALAADEAAAQVLLQAARLAEARNTIVEPYLISVRNAGGQRQPVSFREAIRSAGPTVRTDLAD